MPYIGRSTDGFGVRNRFLYLASASDTSVSGADANGAILSFSDGAYVDVYLNGVLLKAGTDYNTNTANTIAGLSALAANDEVTVIVYDIFAVADTVSQSSGGTFSGAITFSSTVSGLDVNGTEIILDADGDTTITADTDDQIDIKIAGADDFQFTANTFTALSGSSIATNTISETTSGSGVTIDSVLLKDGGIDVNGNEIILDADADTSITADTDDRIDFRVGGSDAVHILSTGQVAIGTTTAPVSEAQLVLSGDGSTDSSPFVEFVNTSASNDETVGGFLSVIGTDSVAEITTRRESANDDAYIFFGTQATGGSLTERMRIDSSGNVGVGNTSPLVKLDVTGSNAVPATSGTSQTGSLRLGQTAGNGVVDMGFDTTNTQGWIQGTNKANLATNYSLALNPNGGAVLKPNQPCFSAYIGSGGHAFEVGDTTPTTIVFNTEHFDNTNSHASGIFTAPVAGKYFFSSTISFYGTDTLRVHDFAWAWYKDDAAYTIQEIGNYIQESGASEFNTLTISIIISLNANQNVRTKMYSFGSPYLSGKINIPTSARSNWHGFLIG